jgi:hypothetical protein
MEFEGLIEGFSCEDIEWRDCSQRVNLWVLANIRSKNEAYFSSCLCGLDDDKMGRPSGTGPRHARAARLLFNINPTILFISS